MPDVIIIRDPSGLLQFAVLALALPIGVVTVWWWLRRIERERR
jgi:uncharacterized membrane-anchored protein